MNFERFERFEYPSVEIVRYDNWLYKVNDTRNYNPTRPVKTIANIYKQKGKWIFQIPSNHNNITLTSKDLQMITKHLKILNEREEQELEEMVG
jgi:hypothetical protein